MLSEEIFLITSILIIWFNTDAFVEYSRLLKIPGVKVKEYLNAKERDYTLTYHTYLLYKYNNFFTRLITCPICLTAWMCLFNFILTDISFYGCLMIFIFSLLIYYIFNKLSS